MLTDTKFQKEFAASCNGHLISEPVIIKGEKIIAKLIVPKPDVSRDAILIYETDGVNEAPVKLRSFSNWYNEETKKTENLRLHIDPENDLNEEENNKIQYYISPCVVTDEEVEKITFGEINPLTRIRKIFEMNRVESIY